MEDDVQACDEGEPMIPSATVIPVLGYPDVYDAAAWLGTAFGLRERVRIEPRHRSQLSYDDRASIAAQSDERETDTDSTLVCVENAAEDCQHARSGGVEITTEPADIPFGAREYGARNPWGHRWTFNETIADMAPGERGGESRQMP